VTRGCDLVATYGDAILPIALDVTDRDAVDSENPPLRLFLGESPLGIATADYDSRLASWREWQPVAAAAQG
jgi:hypothetical protein